MGEGVDQQLRREDDSEEGVELRPGAYGQLPSNTTTHRYLSRTYPCKHALSLACTHTKTHKHKHIQREEPTCSRQNIVRAWASRICLENTRMCAYHHATSDCLQPRRQVFRNGSVVIIRRETLCALLLCLPFQVADTLSAQLNAFCQTSVPTAPVSASPSPGHGPLPRRSRRAVLPAAPPRR